MNRAPSEPIELSRYRVNDVSDPIYAGILASVAFIISALNNAPNPPSVDSALIKSPQSPPSHMNNTNAAPDSDKIPMQIR